MKVIILVSKMALLFTIVTIIQSLPATAQQPGQLTLEEAVRKAQDNYPLTRQRNILKETEGLAVQNLNKNYLPQLSFIGQATHQSDVTQVNVSLPGFKIEPPSVNQYKVYTDLNQVVFDAGVTREQKKLQLQNTKVEEQKLNVELYRLRERVNNVYLSIVLLQEQAGLVVLYKQDIQAGLNKTEAQVANGVALRSQVDVLKSESLKSDQRLIELQSARDGYIQSLGVLLNEKLDSTIQFTRPSPPVVSAEIQRTELNLFNQQTLMFDQQKALIAAKNLPRLNLFGQAGIGRPGLNLLKNETAFYYIGGIRVNWNLNSLYTSKNEKRMLDLNKTMTNLQRETFILNTNSQLAQQYAEIKKLEKLIITDKEIIKLRESIMTASKAQLENHVITSNDYIREANAADEARQSLILRELQLVQAMINYQTIAGKQ